MWFIRRTLIKTSLSASFYLIRELSLLHFHPEHLASKGYSVAQGLLIIGKGSNSFFFEPELWKYFDSYTEVLTTFWRLWHVLVKNSKPLDEVG